MKPRHTRWLVEIVLDARWILDGGTVGVANTTGGEGRFQYGKVGIGVVDGGAGGGGMGAKTRGRDGL
jgi:hypothetical protein